jgi:hypothetical protein
MDTAMTTYEAFDIWKRVSDKQLIRYRCFRNMETNRYVVQSSDWYSLPIDGKRVAFLESQFLELLAESPPDERAPTFESLNAAIVAHEERFRDDPS